ncbi:MAG: LacI family DNA-binding transcriptional regulator [Alphaproteobacteria bacterium]|nr:LacI family DNA-binding transcriptional regulator [Alphaproteobacteria bacterium]
MAPTIRHVAKLANVSVATVSRVINQSEKVKQATRIKVEQAIEQLNFTPNALGRNLSTAHTKSLGVVIPSLSNPVFADAVSGINQQAKSRGYTLMFTSTDYTAQDELQAVTSLLAYQVEGIILTVANPIDNQALNLLIENKIPYVLIYNQLNDAQHPIVTIDNVKSGGAVAQKLLDLGHRKMAMISGNFSASDRARARKQGFVDAILKAGHQTPFIIEVDFIEPNLDRILPPIFADPLTAPTALFCSNDLLAISVIGALGRMGLDVPHNISVIGFDGIAIGAHLHPTLSTVIQPSHEMGLVATQQLLDNINGQDYQKTVILPHIIRTGGSAGVVPPRSKKLINN